jgi:hypothetical protein
MGVARGRADHQPEVDKVPVGQDVAVTKADGGVQA